MIYRSHGAFTPHSEFHFVFSLFRSITPLWHIHKGYVFLECNIGRWFIGSNFFGKRFSTSSFKGFNDMFASSLYFVYLLSSAVQ